MKPVALRWIKFNFVGALGFAVQMGTFALYYGVLSIGKLWATGLAVETAVLHNFFWHEHFTWAHVGKGSGRAGRLLRFHAGNGLVSIVGNVLLVKLFTDLFRVNPYLANVFAVGVCAVANFVVSEHFVFRRR